MPVLFENKYVADEQYQKDIYKFIYLTSPSSLALLIILAVDFVGALIFKQWVLSGVALGLIILRFLGYKTSIKTWKKRTVEMYGGPKEVTITVTEECIQGTGSMVGGFCLHYHDIKKVFSTKKYILMYSKAKLIYAFKKDSFTYGNEADLLNFFRTKGIKVK